MLEAACSVHSGGALPPEAITNPICPDSCSAAPFPSPCLQTYKQDPVFIEKLEDQFLDFLGGKAPRLTLKPMPKAQRALVHEYAEQGWGFVSHSSGNEPNRAVQLFKAPSSGGLCRGVWGLPVWQRGCACLRERRSGTAWAGLWGCVQRTCRRRGFESQQRHQG